MKPSEFRGLRRHWACLVLAGLALPAGAMGLGELQVHSHLGEALDATVLLTTSTAETPRADCFSLDRRPVDDLPQIPFPTFTVEQERAVWRVRIRTRAALNEPAMQMTLNAACEGKDSFTRRYHVLLDPLPVVVVPAVASVATALATSPAVSPVKEAEKSPAARSPGFHSLPGDTLASLARAVYPKSRRVREAYIQALRAANPPLAGLGPDEPIAQDVPIVLPDLRRFSMSQSMATRASQRRAAASPPRARAFGATEDEPPQSTPRLRRERSDAPPSLERPKRRPAAAAPGREQFVLRLSAPDIDLTRSRDVDDRVRNQLRGRLLILDVDDQVAAMLSMQEQLKVLESRVAELQLKISGLPPGSATGVVGVAQAPMAVVPPGAAPSSPTTGAATPPEPVTKTPEPGAKPAPTTTAPVAPAPGAAGSPPAKSWLPTWAWGLALLAAAGLAVVWFVFSRSRGGAMRQFEPEVASDLREAEIMMRRAERIGASRPPGPVARDYRVVAEVERSPTPAAQAPDPAKLRRRYIEERFPEIASGTIAIDSPDSVTKAARLLYQDGALARAVELLQFAVEENSFAMKPWLALFEIYRREGLAREFTDLAGRFRATHGSSENWRKVQSIGRGFDPQEPLFAAAAGAGGAPGGEAGATEGATVAFDPIAENWLNLPMDFTTDELGASLRAGLLADAGLKEENLAADPAPALKKAEKFNAA